MTGFDDRFWLSAISLPATVTMESPEFNDQWDQYKKDILEGYGYAGAMELQIFAQKFGLRTTLHFCQDINAGAACIRMKYCPGGAENQPWLHIVAAPDDEYENHDGLFLYSSSDMPPEFEPMMQDIWGMFQCPCTCASASVIT